MNDIKQKSISQMTIKELGQLNRRLEGELGIEHLILQVKRNNGEKWNTDTKPTINTTTPISQMYPQYDENIKNKTISQMTMNELNLLRDRLRDETRAQDRILDLKRVSGEEWDWENQPAVDTDTPVSQLYHHGILGMKWGVRKNTQTTSRKNRSSKKTESEKKEVKPKSEDYMDSRILKKKTSAGLSNTELKRLNERLNLEKQYKDLTKNDQQKGKNFLANSVSSGLKQTASTVVAASSLYAVKKLIEKSMGGTAASEMFPKKK